MKDASEIEMLEGLEAVRRRPAIRACRNEKRHVLRPETVCVHGLAVLNAACESIELTSWRDGLRFTQSYAAGKPTSAFARVGSTELHGTSFDLALDRTLLPLVEFSTEWLRDWLGAHAGSLRFDVTDGRTGEAFTVGPSPQPGSDR